MFEINIDIYSFILENRLLNVFYMAHLATAAIPNFILLCGKILCSPHGFGAGAA